RRCTGAVLRDGADAGRGAADGRSAREAVVGSFVAGAAADSAAGAWIAGVRAARSARTGVGAVAEQAVVARRRVVVVLADTRTVALVVGAIVAVGIARRCRGGVVVRAKPGAVAFVVRAFVAVGRACRPEVVVAGIGRFVARVLADAAAGAWVAGMDTAGSARAGVGAVAERPVVARSGVVGMRAGSAAIAEVVGADVAVGRARCGVACLRVGGTRNAAAAELGGVALAGGGPTNDRARESIGWTRRRRAAAGF